MRKKTFAQAHRDKLVVMADLLLPNEVSARSPSKSVQKMYLRPSPAVLMLLAHFDFRD